MATQRVPTEQFLTPADVAARVFVDPKTVSRWAAAGKIPSARTPGGHRRFLESDVDVLMSAKRGPDHPGPDPTRSPPATGRSAIPAQRTNGAPPRGGRPPTRETGRVTADTVVAAAVASVLEAHARMAADDARTTAASVALAAETAEAAAVEARRARAFAAAEAAQLVAGEAAVAAAAARSRSTALVGSLADALEEANGLALASDAPAETTRTALRIAATLESVVDTIVADTVQAEAHDVQAVTDAAEQLAVMVTALDLSVERQVSAAAEALHDVTVETARRADQRNSTLARQASLARRSAGP